MLPTPDRSTHLLNVWATAEGLCHYHSISPRIYPSSAGSKDEDDPPTPSSESMCDMPELTEQETRTRFITPAIQNASWRPEQIREEVYFTDGRIIVRRQRSMRGKPP